MKNLALILMIVIICFFSMTCPALSGTEPGDWSGTWRLWTQEPGVNGNWKSIGTIQLEEIKRPDANYGYNYIVQGTYEGGRIESHEPTQSTKIFGDWYSVSPGSSYWESRKVSNSIPITKGSINLEKEWPNYKDLQDKMLRKDDNTFRPYTGADFCGGEIEIFQDDLREVWGFREQKTEIQAGSGTSTQTGANQPGSATGTQTIPSGSCSCDSTKRLVWDGQKGCNCVCENGWKLDPNGVCQQSIANPLGPTTGSQGTPGSSAALNTAALVVNTGQGDTPIKQGDTITLAPNQQAELKAACDKLVTLMNASIFRHPLVGVGRGPITSNFYIDFIYGEYLSRNYPEAESLESFSGMHVAQLTLSKCMLICAKLYSGGYNRKALQIQSSSNSLSDQAAQIELRLEEGPVVFEVVNDQTLLTVDTANLKATSTGKNTFGVINDPQRGNSFVVAYQYPVEVQPTNSQLAPFTLESGQMVAVSANKVGPIDSLSQISSGTNSGSSTYVSPNGKDMYGQTGGAISTAGQTGTSIQGPKGEKYSLGRLLAGPIPIPANRNTPTDLLNLDAGRPYIIVGEGVCSLWSDHTDGVDSCFCYAEWRCPGKPQVWGLLELTNPSIHVSDIIEKDAEGNPVYSSSHVYQAVVTGEGKMLQAKVYDGGGYDDNKGALQVSIYEAIPTQGTEVPSGVSGSTYISPNGKDMYGQTKGPIITGSIPSENPDITGIWYMGGPYNKGMPCQILHNGNALIFINERGDQSAGEFVDSGTVVASDWQGLHGKINDGGNRIDWANGTWWVRTKQEGNSQPQGVSTSGMTGGCHTDPTTGQITCVESFGNSGQGNQGNSQTSSGGCYQDPLTGEITCVDTSGNPISSGLGQGISQGPSSGGCYQDPSTGKITCVDISGNPTSSGSGHDNSQGPASGGCYQDPKTGKITCVDLAGTPEDLSAPQKGCYTDPSTGEVTCID